MPPSARRIAAALTAFLLPAILAMVPLVGVATTAALACACGCSVFDVGGLDTPQEQDHGGRIFFEFWSGDQNENYVGSSKAPRRSIRTRKSIRSGTMSASNTMFNRDWGMMVRMPTTTAHLTTETDFHSPARSKHSIRGYRRHRGHGHVHRIFPGHVDRRHIRAEVSDRALHRAGDRSRYPDRFGQHRPAARRLPSRHAHRRQRLAVFLAGDVAAAVPLQDAADPQGFFDGNAGVVQSYHPGMQVDGAVGILYNNWYNVLGFDKITPLGQVIVSHRNADTGTGADPFNAASTG